MAGSPYFLICWEFLSLQDVEFCLMLFTCVQSTWIILTLLHSLHLPYFSHWDLLLDRKCFTFLSFIFLRCVLTVKWVCCGISHSNISCFHQINPLYYLHFHCCPAPLLFNSFQCISLCYLHTQMQCFSKLFTLYHCLFLSRLPTISLQQTYYYNCGISFSLYVHVCRYVCIYVCIWDHIYLCIHLSFRSSVHLSWGKTCYFCHSDSGFFCLTWWSPFLPIYLKTT
jgi:hypothetical protein